MKTYTEKEVVKLLADFGTHVAEQCTGKKLEIAGELMKWWKLNIPAVMPSVCDCCVPRPEDPFEYDNPICEKCGLPIKQTEA